MKRGRQGPAIGGRARNRRQGGAYVNLHARYRPWP